MTNREIIRELKRCGYSRVDIDTDSRAAKTFYTYRGGLHINGTEDLSFHIVPPQESPGLGRFAICATRNGVEKPCDFDPFGQTGLSPFGYNMIDPLKSWCWGSILFYPFKISRFS